MNEGFKGLTANECKKQEPFTITKPADSDDAVSKVVQLISCIAVNNGATLTSPESLLPLNVELNTDSEFSRGVLSCVMHIYHALSQTAQGRQTILDLGYQPFFEDVKSPRSGGVND